MLISNSTNKFTNTHLLKVTLDVKRKSSFIFTVSRSSSSTGPGTAEDVVSADNLVMYTAGAVKFCLPSVRSQLLGKDTWSILSESTKTKKM